MELNIFVKELESALVSRGIPQEIALKHVSNLRRTFTSDDLTEIEAIQSGDEIEELADSIAVILTKNRKSVASVPSDSKPVMEIRPAPESRSQHRGQASMSSRSARPQSKPSMPTYDDDEFYGYSVEPTPSTKALVTFWVGLFVTLPISLGLLLVIFGAFAAAFAGLAALIIGGIALLIGLVAAGAVVSLICVIFGITQLFSFFAAGIYEIGLGIMVAGAVLFASILVYNFSVRLVPWLITLLGNFLGFVCRKLKDLFFYIRRECYKL